MPNFDTTIAKQQLNKFDFKKLFTQEMGWDNIFNKSITICVDKINYELKPIAQKRLLVVYECCSEIVPNRAIQKKIHAETRKISHENFIIFTDKKHTAQQWFFVWRDPGKTIRAHVYEPNDDLYQRLKDISFSIQQEETLSPIEVLSRIRSNFDVDRVTRSFYDNFKKEHTALMKFLEGIPDQDLKPWYVSVTLNRLMFVYFIQKQNFLDNNSKYLVDKLADSKKRGADLFYRNFLCPLFFEGFAKQERDNPEINKLLGDVPYLNGGIFQKHQLEERFGEGIQIPDKAFDQIFEFFDRFRWHLDDRPTGEQNEINPDVLGYIFEKYINQKQMGAYYTKEDITGYISRNTIIPWLFDQAKKECKIAFEGKRSVWDLLQEEPDRYIYQAVQTGCQLKLPTEIASGIEDVSQRILWNTPAPEEFALPTEIWRETIARRQHYDEIHSKLVNGEIRAINDLITYNLDIELFAQDVIQNAEGPELVRAFWKALTTIKILDPTVGSGAFLFAAMNILEPLYEDCIEQMEHYVSALGSKDHPDKYKDFKIILKQIQQHTNEKYYIYKTITLQNLYGVDIMEEAVETCKLRLFLKLVSQVQNRKDFEPLPDIDFNIRAGNTLIGFTNLIQVKEALSRAKDFSKGGKVARQEALLMMPEEENQLQMIQEEAELAGLAYNRFQEMQTNYGMNTKTIMSAKKEIQDRLIKLNKQLNIALALSYNVKPDDTDALKKWADSHKPFNWVIDFYEIIKKGGFDIVIGNPPYVEYNKIREQYTIQNYKTENCRNLYAFVIERSRTLINQTSKFGVIIPISAFANSSMTNLRAYISENFSHVYISSFHQRPAQLFDGVLQRLSIFIALNNNLNNKTFTTQPIRWYSENRDFLFQYLNYVHTYESDIAIPKIGDPIEKIIFNKIQTQKIIDSYKINFNDHNNSIFFRTAGGGYWLTFLLNGFNTESLSNKEASFLTDYSAPVFMSLLNSSLFWWYYYIHFDLFNLKDYMIFSFKFTYPNNKFVVDSLTKLAYELESSYLENAEEYTINSKTRGANNTFRYNNRKSKHIIDLIDKILAQHYGFTDKELDFIINYDIKYRMGDELLDNVDE
ncbi:MAG: Eco57I restriction-modification methylase domain-containing protein [Anaerolineaceae bacterium]|nr:Eco57I restriction-modification methylase domain-containing protein [Anaerolineaceae bacterium]